MTATDTAIPVDTKMIRRYPLDVIDDQLIELPADAKIRSAGDVNGNPCLWVETRNQGKAVVHWITMYPDNGLMTDLAQRYLGTCHVFDLNERLVIRHMYEVL